ncbi:hypothetical protein DPMN_127282 [Dreissena polymorpha]|uniref:Uncharacterized protein n=1 Tax=Dreissena polymorpha TaxID=45954 RepID=A0A9D4H4Y3_DREPO|nr:hypothetical protein DPMN_127282 [Dreissena polymorpha]
MNIQHHKVTNDDSPTTKAKYHVKPPVTDGNLSLLVTDDYQSIPAYRSDISEDDDTPSQSIIAKVSDQCQHINTCEHCSTFAWNIIGFNKHQGNNELRSYLQTFDIINLFESWGNIMPGNFK